MPEITSDKVKAVTFCDQQQQQKGSVVSERSRLAAAVTPAQYTTCFIDPNVAIESSPDNYTAADVTTNTVDVIRSSRVAKAKHYTRKFLVFVFSTAGMSLLLAVYVCLGGLIFQRIEEPGELARRQRARDKQAETVQQLWKLVDDANVFYPELWREQAREVLLNYTIDVYKTGHDDAFNTDPANTPKWNYPNALLYSITIITTIGRSRPTLRTSITVMTLN